MKTTLLCLSLCFFVPASAHAYVQTIAPDSTGECQKTGYHGRGRYCRERKIVETNRSEERVVRNTRLQRLKSGRADRSRRTRSAAVRPSKITLRNMLNRRGSTINRSALEQRKSRRAERVGRRQKGEPIGSAEDTSSYGLSSQSQNGDLAAYRKSVRNDSKRERDLYTIRNVLHRYIVQNSWNIPPSIPEQSQEICRSRARSCRNLFNLEREVGSEFIADVPRDPDASPSSFGTDYFIELSPLGFLLTAPNAKTREIQIEWSAEVQVPDRRREEKIFCVDPIRRTLTKCQ